MTDGKQGAAEWLRGIIDEYRANGAQSCSAMARMFGINCKYETCRGCMTGMMAAIADRIDAERALPEGVEWPRFEDGELVGIGDEVSVEGETWEVRYIILRSERWALKVDRDYQTAIVCGDYGERLKRPKPKALDADGAPINVGDTVYCEGNEGPFTVDYVHVTGYRCVTIKSTNGMCITVDPKRLTHKRPDSWERLEEDAAKQVCAYAGAQKSIADANRYTCIECPYDEPGPHTDAGCNERMRLDLVRRAKALAKAGE